MKPIQVEDLYHGMLVYDLMVGGRALRVKDWRVWQVPREDNDQVREEYVHVSFDGCWDVFPGGVRESEEPLACIDARTDYLSQCIAPLMDEFVRMKISEEDGKATARQSHTVLGGARYTGVTMEAGSGRDAEEPVRECSAMMNDMVSAI